MADEEAPGDDQGEAAADSDEWNEVYDGVPDDLEAPDGPDDLYEAREQVSAALPIMQGDVFADVAVPGLPESPLTVQIVMHPCSMRGYGGKLHPRITVAPVYKLPQAVDKKLWAKSGRQMPLPDLYPPAQDAYASKFVDLTAVPAEELTWTRRVAALSHVGLMILQQRLAWFHARVVVPPKILYRESRPVLVEMELQADWVEEAIDARGETDEVLAAATADFQAWLEEDARARRGMLHEEAYHVQLRRDARTTARGRYGHG